jgi:hypothetical protein
MTQFEVGKGFGHQKHKKARTGACGTGLRLTYQVLCFASPDL